MVRRTMMIGGIAGLLSIACGAFGAHALERVLEPSALETYHTGVEYQMIHAIALILTGILASQESIKAEVRWLRIASYGFITGIILFSGSLYIVSLAGISAFGMIAPIGGVSLMLGWFGLIMSVRRIVDRRS